MFTFAQGCFGLFLFRYVVGQNQEGRMAAEIDLVPGDIDVDEGAVFLAMLPNSGACRSVPLLVATCSIKAGTSSARTNVFGRHREEFCAAVPIVLNGRIIDGQEL